MPSYEPTINLEDLAEFTMKWERPPPVDMHKVDKLPITTDVINLEDLKSCKIYKVVGIKTCSNVDGVCICVGLLEDGRKFWCPKYLFENNCYNCDLGGPFPFLLAHIGKHDNMQLNVLSWRKDILVEMGVWKYEKEENN